MTQAIRYSLSGLRADIRYYLETGRLRRTQPVSALCRLYSGCDWQAIRTELELAGICPDDRLCDLLGPEDWPDD